MRNLVDYSIKYSEENFESIQVGYRRRKVIEQIKKYQPKRCLEIGCGMAPLFLYDEEREYTIIEPSEKFFNNAVSLAKNKKVNCIRGYFENLATEIEKKWDMIICSSLLHEVEEPDILLESIRRTCGENTIVHINVPNADSMHRLLAKESGMIEDVHERSERNILYQQKNVFDIKELKKIIKKHDMCIIDEGSYFIKPFSHEQMYKIVSMGIIEEAILEGLYNMEKFMPGMGSELFVNCKVNN